MNIEKSKNKIIITGDHFSVREILCSGQVFRFNSLNSGYTLTAGKEFALLKQSGQKTVIECTDEEYFYNYFDLDTDYSVIIKKLEENCLIKGAVNYGRGIRILKQEKLETVISFIISANNNIKRIQGIIDRICLSLGEKYNFNGMEYYAFPPIEKLAQAGEDFYKSIGAGYRASYLDKTSKEIALGFDLTAIENMTLNSAEKSLMSLYGIGKKVCDCILLFAYGRQDVFPVDTWIEKVYYDSFCTCGEKICREKIAEHFTGIFKEYSGYAQQYLFYYKRNFKSENK